MGSGDQIQVVGVIEVGGDVLTERVACASWGDAPACSVVRVGPQKVAHRALVRHFDASIQLLDVVKCVQVWRQAAVEAEDLVLDDCCERQQVKQVSEVLPNVGISVLPEALVVKAVNLCNLS